MKTPKMYVAVAALAAVTSWTPALYAQQAGADVTIKHDRDYPPHTATGLNADRDKIKTAPGCAATNWPDVGSGAWGSESFWTTDAASPRTDSSGKVYGKSELYTDANRDRTSTSAGVRSDYNNERHEGMHV